MVSVSSTNIQAYYYQSVISNPSAESTAAPSDVQLTPAANTPTVDASSSLSISDKVLQQLMILAQRASDNNRGQDPGQSRGHHGHHRHGDSTSSTDGTTFKASTERPDGTQPSGPAPSGPRSQQDSDRGSSSSVSFMFELFSSTTTSSSSSTDSTDSDNENNSDTTSNGTTTVLSQTSIALLFGSPVDDSSSFEGQDGSQSSASHHQQRSDVWHHAANSNFWSGNNISHQPVNSPEILAARFTDSAYRYA